MVNRVIGLSLAFACTGLLLTGCTTTQESAAVAQVAASVDVGVKHVQEAPRYRLPFADNPQQLYGLSDNQVTRIFGEPGFRRRDKPAEMWRYSTDGCILDVFLYPDGADFRVAHAEVRDPAVTRQLKSDHCLTSIVDRRNG